MSCNNLFLTHNTLSKHCIASSVHTQSSNGRVPVSFSLTDHIAQTGLGKKPTGTSVFPPPGRHLDESADSDDSESDDSHNGSVSPLHSFITNPRRPSLSLSTSLYTTTDGKVMLPGDRYRRDPYAVSVLKSSATSPVPSSTSSNKGSSASRLAAVASPMSVTSPVSPMSTSHMDCAWATAASHQQQAVTTAAPTPSGCYYATVRFKKGSAVYISDSKLGEGEYVLVEADRGEHIGVVTGIKSEAPVDCQEPVSARVLRLADTEDIIRLNKLRLKEETSLFTVRSQVQKLSVNLHVTDNEFQLDGKKLTIYYKSSAPADFRKLQRRLHSKFKCRIWLMPEEELSLPNTPGC